MAFGTDSEVKLRYQLIDIDNENKISYLGSVELDVERGKLLNIPVLPIDRGEVKFTPGTQELSVTYQKLLSMEFPLAVRVKFETDGKLNETSRFGEKNSWEAGLSWH